uniref:Major facilitator superfamily (MFS) profile domain-containing protein n=1 Tax=Ananas comosus var. bracteatus TaxID=296719 RepID=A0A6V7NVM2_ANACO|nr:unnamed protein product [Ananas comosus var. bracteatus]
MIAPVYTAELSPAASRGALTSFPEVFINSGVLLGYVANFAFAKLPLRLGWRAMFLAGAVPPVFLGAGVLAMPESPRWLVMQGRLDDARRVLAKTTGGPDEAELRLQRAWASTRSAGAGGGVAGAAGAATPSVRRILLAALGLQFFQQASGIDSVVLYSPRVFQKAGIRSDSNSLGATVAVGFTKTAFILVATFFLDRVGRRPLLLASAGGMVASLLALASALRIIDDRAHDHSDGHGGAAAAVAIAAVLSFVGSFSIGLGPIAWVYSSEIFPLRLRAQGASMGTAMNRVMSGVITMTFISLYNAITISGSFFLYAGVAAMGWVFFYVFLPETRGRSLEDMEVLFGRKRVEEEKEKGKEGGEEGVVENKGDAEGESQENHC